MEGKIATTAHIRPWLYGKSASLRSWRSSGFDSHRAVHLCGQLVKLNITPDYESGVRGLNPRQATILSMRDWRARRFPKPVHAGSTPVERSIFSPLV
jgi:hypothetical protein